VHIKSLHIIIIIIIVGIKGQADEKLFQLVGLLLTNPSHVLSSLLPDKTDQCYYLRARGHDRQFVDKRNKLFSNNFITCMLYICCYWFVCISCVLTT